MATLDGGDNDLPNEVRDIIHIAWPYITKRMCERECLHSERKVLSPDFKENEDTESFERNYQVCLLAMSRIWE